MEPSFSSLPCVHLPREKTGVIFPRERHGVSLPRLPPVNRRGLWINASAG